MKTLSLIVENKGSTARDHLANERTFLAWLRTSVTMVTVGIAIAQLSKVGPPDPNAIFVNNIKLTALIGIIYAGIGIIFAVLGLLRYFNIQSELTKCNFPISRFSVILGVSLTLGMAIVVSIVALFDSFVYDQPNIR